MKRNSNLLTDEHPERGVLWASFDPSVHHVVGFKSRGEAEAALAAECGA